MSPKAFFRGDAPQLLDALIAASQVPMRARSANAEWVGRELVPWTADETAPALDQPLEAGGRRAGKFPAPQRPVRGAPAKRSKVGAPGAGAAPRRAPADFGGFACPALAASPKPEALPMPTTGLLSRANRSPSPPKDCWAPAPAALVLVAA